MLLVIDFRIIRNPFLVILVYLKLLIYLLQQRLFLIAVIMKNVSPIIALELTTFHQKCRVGTLASSSLMVRLLGQAHVWTQSYFFKYFFQMCYTLSIRDEIIFSLKASVQKRESNIDKSI